MEVIVKRKGIMIVVFADGERYRVRAYCRRKAIQAALRLKQLGRRIS